MAAAAKAGRREKDRTTGLPKMAESPPKVSVATSLTLSEEISAAVTAAITAQLEALSGKIDTLQGSLSALGARMHEAEGRVLHTEEAVEQLQRDLSAVQKLTKAQDLKIDDLENRSRRNNLRFLGIAEKVPDKDLRVLVERMAASLLGRDSENTPIIVDRAHRVGPRPQGENTRPRVVLARFLYYVQKDDLLRAARQQGVLEFENMRLRITPDYSTALSHRRKAYAPVCQRLLSANIRFYVQYPARLHILHQGTHRVLESAAEAATFVEQLLASSENLQGDRRP